MNHPFVVEVSGLSVFFGDHVILDSVTFHVAAGRFIGLIGPNGAGKTTLLKALLGITKPDRGSIKIFGQPPGKAHNLISYVPQSPQFEPSFPILGRDVVMMGRYNMIGTGKFPGKEDHSAVDESLERVGVSDIAYKKFGSLSGGERQKILIARALSPKPKLLLLDEPTTGVDAPSQDSFYGLLHSLINEMKMTIMLVSHDIGVITSHVDDIICINQKVFCHGPPKEVFADGLIGKAYGSEAEVIMHGHGEPHRMVKRHHEESGK